MKISDHDILLVVDVQNDFCPGGALAIPEGDRVVEVIRGIASGFRHIALTQDWHPGNHSSFASAHPGKQPFEAVATAYGSQTLWPDHCVQGTWGAEFHPGLELTQAEFILRKGFRREIDSYSAFFENDRVTPTGLFGYLQERSLTHVILAGLAYDYCVGFSALDGRRLGLSVSLYRNACQAIALGQSQQEMDTELRRAGVTILDGS
jgi:nicotinamidase/pyrazinamidase